MNQVDPSMLDVFYRSLADRRRRFVLTYLLDETDGSTCFDALVDRVVRAETASTPPERQPIEVSLDHHHLPMLAEQGLIEYNRPDGNIKTTPRTEQVEPLLQVAEKLN